MNIEIVVTTNHKLEMVRKANLFKQEQSWVEPRPDSPRQNEFIHFVGAILFYK